MSSESRDVTKEYKLAQRAAEKFHPGDQSDIAGLMKSSYIHGYAQALTDFTTQLDARLDKLLDRQATSDRIHELSMAVQYWVAAAGYAGNKGPQWIEEHLETYFPSTSACGETQK